MGTRSVGKKKDALREVFDAAEKVVAASSADPVLVLVFVILVARKEDLAGPGRGCLRLDLECLLVRRLRGRELQNPGDLLPLRRRWAHGLKKLGHLRSNPEQVSRDLPRLPR